MKNTKKKTVREKEFNIVKTFRTIKEKINLTTILEVLWIKYPVKIC